MNCTGLVAVPILILALLSPVIPWQASVGVGFGAEQPTLILPGSPLGFGYIVENVGQLGNGEVMYYGAGHGVVVGFADRAVLLLVARSPTMHSTHIAPSLDDHADPLTRAVSVQGIFEGANPVAPEGKDELPHRSSFFIGSDPAKWRTNVRSFREVVYENLYDGIDLRYHASDAGIKYEFIVRVGADPGLIRIAYEGAERVFIDDSGNLVLSTAVGEVRDTVPLAFQEGRPVQCAFVLLAPLITGFRCPASTAGAPLIIDPIIYGTFLGGGLSDEGHSLAIDAGGNAYIVGRTGSSDFPVTPGAFDISVNGTDVFIAKLNATGDALLWATFLGGSRTDVGDSIALDDAGNVYVAGSTESADFPTTAGAFDRTCGSDGNCDLDGNGYHGDAFVAKLGSAGSVLLNSTFLGGRLDDDALSLAQGLDGTVFVAGVTQSADFPTTADAFDRICGTDGNCDYDGSTYYSDAFVAQLSAAGDTLLHATYLGGRKWDYGLHVIVDSSSGVRVGGYTNSPDYPTTPGAFDRTCGSDGNCDAGSVTGGDDGYVATLSAHLDALVYSTFVGGSSSDAVVSFAATTSGEIVLVGWTRSQDFPTTPGAFSTSLGSAGSEDAFVAKLNASGDSLIFGTFLGGIKNDSADSIALSASGDAYVTGVTQSPDFPTTPGARDPSYGAPYDGYVARVSQDGHSLLFSTFLGGTEGDNGLSLALDSADNVYVTGRTSSSSDFPVTPGAFDVTYNGGGVGDAFVVKMKPLPDLSIAPSDLYLAPSPPIPASTPSELRVNVTNVGDYASTSFQILGFEDLNGNGQIDPGEPFGLASGSSLAPLERTNMSIQWTPMTSGVHRLCAWADPPPGIIEEIDEGNNSACADVPVIPAPETRPDYTPVAPQPLPPIKVGTSLPVSLSIQILNQGNGTAPDDSVVAFFEQSSPPFSTFVLSPLAPATTSPRFTATWISPAIPGIYSVSVDVDHDGNVTEWDETNNFYTWTIEVVSGPVTTLVIGYPNYTSPAMATYVRSTTPLSLFVLDQSGLGIRNTTYTIDGGNPVNYTATGSFFLAGEGVHKIEWRSLDWAGNLEDVSSMNLTVDDTPPATTIHQSDMNATTATVFTLAVIDSGCGMNITKYRIDGGSWNIYPGGFTLPEGVHNISYYSNDMLNNTEGEKWLVVTVEGTTTPPELAVNYKPVVALMFTIILLVAGVWSSKRRPWRGGKDGMAAMKAFAIISLPFVIAEAGTGILSFATGELGIPPYVSIGTAIDLIILLAGLGTVISRLIKRA